MPRIIIDPPLTPDEAEAFEFRTVEPVPARGSASGAAFLMPRTNMNYKPDWIREHIQDIVDHFPGHKFIGFVEFRNSSGGYPPVSRYYVRDRVVEQIDARIVWPKQDGA